MEKFDKDRYYLNVDDCVKRTDDEKKRDKEFVRYMSEKFHLSDEDSDNEIIVLPTQEFYYLIVTVINEYESHFKLFSNPDKS